MKKLLFVLILIISSSHLFAQFYQPISSPGIPPVYSDTEEGYILYESPKDNQLYIISGYENHLLSTESLLEINAYGPAKTIGVFPKHDITEDVFYRLNYISENPLNQSIPYRSVQLSFPAPVYYTTDDDIEFNNLLDEISRILKKE